MSETYEPSEWDYFVGGVPPSDMFKISLNQLRELVNSYKEEHGLNYVAEVSLIGLAAYFEAFCSNEFAAVVNICPQLLGKFVAKRGEVSVHLGAFETLGYRLDNRLGFLLSEKYDFGSAKSINSLYRDLLSFTPFSAAEARRYERLLNDRNLLVHRGGVYIHKYLSHTRAGRPPRDRVYFDSLVVLKKDFGAWSQFLETMAVKISTQIFKATSEFCVRAGVKVPAPRGRALEFLRWSEL